MSHKSTLYLPRAFANAPVPLQTEVVNRAAAFTSPVKWLSVLNT